MRINELLVEQQIDELSLKGLGQGIGKAVGGVVGGAGQLARNIWSGAKQGYDSGRAALDPNAPDTDPSAAPAAPASSGGAAGGPGEVASNNLLARAKQGTTQDPAAQQPAPTAPAQPTAPAGQTPAPAAPGGAPADQSSKLGVGQINKIIPTLRTRDLQSVKKNVDATLAKKAPAAKPAAPAAPAAAPAAPATPPEDDNPNIVKGYNENRKVVGIRSRFLSMDI